jgi:hypothetical protein
MGRLGRFWQTLSVDLPWAISNWLWANVVNPLMAEMMQLTPRRLVYLAAFTIFFVAIAWAAAEFMFPADVVLMLAGDSALYIEIVSFAYLVLVRNRTHSAIKPVVQMMRALLRRAVSHITARARRPMRRPRLFGKTDSDDVPDGAFFFA